MSVQCPHCGGDFNLEVKLTVPVLTECKPRAVLDIPEKAPTFRTSTPSGKFRKALWDAGYKHAAVTGTIYNDKRTGGESRLKLVQSHRNGPFDLIDRHMMNVYLYAEFGYNLLWHGDQNASEYVVQFNRFP